VKPLPDLNDAAAMAARGRRSVLMSARNEACEELRDVSVAIQRCDVFNDDVSEFVKRGHAALDRLQQLHGMKV